MTRKYINRLAIGFMALMLALTSGGLLAARAAPPEDFTAFDQDVQARLDSARVPGAAIAIVQGDQFLRARGFGTATDGGQYATPRTPFVLGSTSKSFTALAVLQLSEAGKVDLDAPVTRYVPGFHLADGRASEITVRNLLNQTSGIPANAGGEIYRSTHDVTQAEALDALSGTKLAHDPGTTFEYANPNYVLLGFVIESASGQSYADYLQANVFDPLEMHHSYTVISEAQGDDLAQGHRYWFGVPVASGLPQLNTLLPAGYIVSTAEDVGHFLMLLLNNGTYHGRTILSPDGVATLLNPVSDATLGAWADGADAKYAMGWFVGGPWNDPSIRFHPGEPPNYTSMFVLIPDQHLGMVMLMNAGLQLPLPGADGVLDRIPSETVSLLLGQQPASAMSLNRFYLIFDAVVFLIVAVQVWSLLRLIRRPTHNRQRGLSVMLSAVPLIWEIVLGVALLLAPGLIGMSWRSAWLWMPDLTLVLLVAGTLWLITAAVRVYRLGQITLSRRAPVAAKSTARGEVVRA